MWGLHLTSVPNLTLNSMLEYYKAVLSNITFDAMLFRKELRKAMRHLVVEDRMRLRDWLKQSGIV